MPTPANQIGKRVNAKGPNLIRPAHDRVIRANGGNTTVHPNGTREIEIDPTIIRGDVSAVDDDLDMSPETDFASNRPDFLSFDQPDDSVEEDSPAQIEDARHRYGPQQFARDVATQILPESTQRYTLPLVNEFDRGLREFQNDEDYPEMLRNATRGYDPEALAMGAAQGLTLNRFDELAGSIAQARSDGTPEEAEAANQATRARLRREEALGASRSPVSHAIGSLVGSAPIALAIPGGTSGTLARRVVTGGLAGAGLGEAYGTGAQSRDLAEDPIGVTAGAAPQAALGGFVGASAPVVTEAIRGVGRMAVGGGQRALDRIMGRAPIAEAEEVAATAPGEFAGVSDAELAEASPADLARADRRAMANPLTAFGGREDPARRIADRLSQQQRDLEPFTDEGIGLKRDRIAELMRQDELEMYRQNPAALEERLRRQGFDSPDYEVVDVTGRETAPARRVREPAQLPSDTEAAPMPMMRDQRGRMVARNAEPLPPGPLRETNGRILPALTESNEPAALEAVPEADTMQLDVRARERPREFAGQGDSGAWQEMHYQASNQANQASDILDRLESYAEDPRNMRAGIVRQRLPQLTELRDDAIRYAESGDRAQAFIALDRMKRAIGQIRRAAERGIPDEALAAQAEQAYETLRRGLEDPAAWGQGAAALQRETNAAWTRYLGTSREADRFLADVGQRGSNPWNDVPVADAEAVQGMVDNAPRWQQQEQRNLFRRHAEATGDLAGTLQRNYGGNEALANRAQNAGREMSARLGLEEQRANGPIMDLARRVGDNRVGRGLQWLSDAFGAVPNNPATQELRSIIESTAGPDIAPALSRRADQIIADFAGFVQQHGRAAPAAIGELWRAYQQRNPQAAEDLQEIRNMLHEDASRLSGATSGETQVEEAHPVDAASLREMSNRVRERAERFER